jgi:hypothetical protein
MLMLAGCGANPEGVTTDYLTALTAGEFDKAVDLSTVETDRNMQNGKSDEKTQIAKAYVQHMSFVVKSAEKDGDRYIVSVDITGPDLDSIMDHVATTALSGLFADRWVHA